MQKCQRCQFCVHQENLNTTDTGRGIRGLPVATGDVGTSTGEKGNDDPEPGSDKGIARHETMFDVLGSIHT